MHKNQVNPAVGADQCVRPLLAHVVSWSIFPVHTYVRLNNSEVDVATKVVLPFLGQTMEEGTITKWLKKEGDKVEKGEILFEVMTDKANMEVESPESGVLLKIVSGEGSIVPVKETVGVIGAAGEKIDDLIGNGAASAAVETPAQAPVPETVSASPKASAASGDRLFISPRARKVAGENGIAIEFLAGKGTGPAGRIVEKDVLAFASPLAATPAQRVSPLADKVAADTGVDISTVIGTGPAGRVMRDDVTRAVPPMPLVPFGKRGIGRIIPYTGMRKAVGENVAASVRNAPQVTFVTEVDMTDALAMRDSIAAEAMKRYGIKISSTALVIKAAALAILDYPIVNSSLVEKEIVIHDDINLCVAVSIEDGLVTPVIPETDRKSLVQISSDIKTLAGKARAGQLSREDMSGGTFTVSSLTSTCVDSFNPIINPPQSAILGMCRVVEKPVVINGEIKIRSMMGLSLVWDHRVMDGAPAADYLGRVKGILESPMSMLI